MELKEQLKEELLKQKEEKRKLDIKINSNLKEIILYTKPNDSLCDNYKKFYNEQGIKFKEKDINLSLSIFTVVGNNRVPIIFINDEYLVHGRDFQSPAHSINALRHFANPKYKIPSFEHRLIESLKNLNYSLFKNMGNLNKQIAPITKIMNELAQEEDNS